MKHEFFPLLSAITMLVGSCTDRLAPIETPQEKLRAVTTEIFIQCKGDFSEEKIKAIWDQEFPGQSVYPYLSSPKGKELANILRQWESDDCKLDASSELLTPSIKLRIDELTN